MFSAEEEEGGPLPACPGSDDPQALTMWAAKAMAKVPIFRRLRALDDALLPRLATAMVAAGVRAVTCAPQAHTSDWVSPWRDSEMLLVCHGDLEILNAATANKALGCEKPGALVNEVGALGRAVAEETEGGAGAEAAYSDDSSDSSDGQGVADHGRATLRPPPPAVLAARGAAPTTCGGGVVGVIGGGSSGSSKQVAAAGMSPFGSFRRKHTMVLALPHTAAREALKLSTTEVRHEVTSYCAEQRWLAAPRQAPRARPSWGAGGRP